MARSRSVPSYRKHRQSGQAIVTLTDDFGCRRDVLLGKHGAPASRHEYARVIAEWEATGRQIMVSTTNGPDLTVNEMLLGYWRYVEQHYRHADGTPTSEVNDMRLSLRLLRELYGHTRAADFGPLSLKAVRQRMIASKLCRNVVNQRTNRIRRAFKWAVENELIAPNVLTGLQAVKGLQRGRSEARERPPVTPVPPAIVEATLPHLLPPVRAMVELQRFTGMRPAEVCAMRACDLDMTGAVWTYRPERHKGTWAGRDRVVCIGPQAQRIIREFLALDTQAHLFQPSDAMATFRAQQRANRKTKVQPSQQDRRKKRRRKGPGDHYTTASYGQAIARACDDAFPPPEELRQGKRETKDQWFARLGPDGVAKLKEWRSTHRWYPNRLRHLHATTVRREFGLEAAQVALGHSQADITQIYAERNQALAEKVAAAMG